MAGSKTARLRLRRRVRKAKRPPARKPGARAPKAGGPLLRPADVRVIIEELAAGMAPADATRLVSHEAAVRERAAVVPAPKLAAFRAQIELALDIVRDHLRGECPQIPYRTISLMAAALSYFVEHLDVVPDFLPQVGAVDDAVVMEVACQLGRDGLQRYCDWKGRPCPVAPRRGARR
jgi:uncharacterized membrane protein YkvA (DUF1232 family)